jgi:hypothetical protein
LKLALRQLVVGRLTGRRKTLFLSCEDNVVTADRQRTGRED